MIISSLTVKNFRNIEHIELAPTPGVNIIAGDNGEGKSNLAEALWLFTGTKSFRGSKDSELIKLGTERAELKASFISEGREQNAEIIFSPKKSIKKNGIVIKTPADYFGTCTGVCFSPLQMGLFKNGPVERRHLMDTSLCQLSPKFSRALIDYSKILMQRNSLLKDIFSHRELYDMLDIYDSQLSNVGAYIAKSRAKYVYRLNEKAKEIYEGISSGKEEFSSLYRCSFLEESEMSTESSLSQWADALKKKLEENRKHDIINGATGVGPHRDDLAVYLDNLEVKPFASQGQQRSSILALKLSESKLLGEAMGEAPLIILDDVMSELDAQRRGYILNSIGESQIFLSCCDESLFSSLEGGKVFHVKQGAICTEA